MKHYPESPPKELCDKEFVDDMVCLYIQSICEATRLWQIIYNTEELAPCKTTNDRLEEAYHLLNEVDANIGQLTITFKMKIAY